MSLATRCPSCSTTFRVVRDQLKVSEGWVRCGRCGEVFCALDSLFELERDFSPSQLPDEALAGDWAFAPQTTQQASAAARPADSSTPDGSLAVASSDSPQETPTRPATPFSAAIDVAAGEAILGDRPPAAEAPPDDSPPQAAPATTPAAASTAANAAPEAAAAWAPVDETGPVPSGARARPDDTPADEDASPTEASSPDAADAPVPPEALESAIPADRTPDSETEPASARDPETPLASDVPVPALPPEAAPSFLQRAQREERLRHPAVRATRILLVGTLGLLLVLQIALHQRDRLAAEWPAARPWLEQACLWAGCQIGPLRRIDDVVIDHHALVDAGPGRKAYRLNLLLNNRSALPLALPAIELSLTDDTRGELVARRVLQAADFGHHEVSIAPHAQLALSLQFSTPGHRVTSYKVEAFYP